MNTELLEQFLYDLNSSMPEGSVPIVGEVLEDKIFISLYNNGTYGAGLGVELKGCSFNKEENTFEGGEFFLYGAAFNNEKVVFAPMQHTCMRGSTYKGALLLSANIISMLNSDNVASALYLLIPQTVMGISVAERKVGIMESPLINLVYENLKNSLVTSLIEIKNNNYMESPAYAFSLGSLLKNLLDLNLDSTKRNEIYELLSNKKLIKYFKMMKGNYELTRNDGMGNFIEKIDSLIDYVSKHENKDVEEIIKFSEEDIKSNHETITIEINDISELEVFDPEKDTPTEYLNVEPSDITGLEVFDPEKDNTQNPNEEEYINVKLGSTANLEIFDPEKDNAPKRTITFCPHCGHKLSDDEHICSYCGSEL